MERGASPTPSSCHSSQDLGRPRKSVASYRLFPIVEPTPPASPVTLRRASLQRAPGASRRRSSSLENGPNIKEAITVSLHTTPPQFALSSSDRATIGNTRHGNQAVASPSRDITTSFANSPSPSFASSLRTKRSKKPNLRITVAPENVVDRAPGIPLQSPIHCGEGQDLSHSSLATRPSRDPPSTSDFTSSAIAQQQSFVPVGANVKVRELPVTSPAGRGRSVRKFWPKIFPREQGSASPTQLNFGNHESLRLQTRPSTAGVLSPRSPTLSSLTPTKGSGDTISDRLAISRPLESRTVHVTSPTDPPITGLRLYKSAERLRSGSRLGSPSVVGNVAMAEDQSVGRTQRFAGSALESPSTMPLPVRPSTADDRQSIADAIRNHTRAPIPPRPSDDESSPTVSFIRPQASTALAIARANVAALRNSSFSSDGSAIAETSGSSGSEVGSFNRALAADALTRRASNSNRADPVAALKDLSEQCDALHARYAGLRAERQKMSSGLVDKLKAQRTDPDYLSTLLNDQLSLAAVSSSMDICFAKLKSLECRKEDAVAALIAQSADVKTSPREHIATMIASMAVGSCTKSLAPSPESDNRYALTGRSTPDYPANRSTQSSLPRSFSYSSETTNQEYTLSCASSLRNDSACQTDLTERLAPETIPEAVESPHQKKADRPHDLLVTQTNEGSDEPFLLSPTRFEPPQTNKKVLNLREVELKPEARTFFEVEPGDGFIHGTLNRICVPGSRSARVLGLLPKDGEEDPLMKLPPELSNLSSAGNAEIDSEIHPQVPTSDLPTPPFYSDAHHGSAEMLESPAIHDLEAQLEHFPKPVNPSARPLPKQFTVLAPLAANPPTPVVETFGERYSPEKTVVVRPPRRDSARATQQQQPHQQYSGDNNNTTKTVTRSMTQGSTRTTHTIQVYIEQDDFEILNLYRRGAEAATAAGAEPMPVS